MRTTYAGLHMVSPFTVIGKCIPKLTCALFLLLLMPVAFAGAEQSPELDEAIETFQTKQNRAYQDLLEDFDKVQDKILKSRAIPPEAATKLLAQLAQERKVFAENPTILPTATGLATALSRYKRVVGPAYERCLKSFDDVADGYRQKGLVEELDAVMKAKSEFRNQTEVFDFSGVWTTFHSNGWRGTRTIHGVTGTQETGKLITWTRKGKEIVVYFPVGSETLTIDLDDTNLLKGTTERGLRSEWRRAKK